MSREKKPMITCSECPLPVAKVERGCLIITSRHHGKAHITTLSLDWLRREIERQDGAESSLPQSDGVP